MLMRCMRAVICLGFIAGCAAVELESGAQQVRIITTEPQGCEYLGEVTGSQGNFFTGGYTSNANLETGARNDMKNQPIRWEPIPFKCSPTARVRRGLLAKVAAACSRPM